MSIIPSPAGSSPARPRPPLDPASAVEVFLGERPELPAVRPPVATPGGAAVVTVADVDGLADWLAACGGTIRRSTPDGGVQMWQLYTSLPRTDGSRTAVRVVTAAAEDVPVPDEVLSAVVSGGPRVTARGALTPDRIARIRARIEAATPGPWAVDSSGVFGADTVVAVVGGYERVVGSLAFGDGEDAEADRAFTLHASEDMRALLAEVERMADELAALAWAHRLDAHGLDAFLLDLASAAGGYWQRDDHAHVLARVKQVFAEHEHEAALAGDGPHACGHDGLDRCENCGKCPCECRCAPAEAGEHRG